MPEGVKQRKGKTVSAGYLYRLRLIAEGRCAQCGKDRLYHAQFCEDCQVKARLRWKRQRARRKAARQALVAAVGGGTHERAGG